MKFGSVCSGIEAASVAWSPLGWRPAFFSENDAAPSRVLEVRQPEATNLGDMNDFKKWPEASVDVLAGGTPCQSFSIGGLRKGLADPRGNLALVYLAIVKRYGPTVVVWENVPGVLSSHKGRDFGTFIGALAKLGYGCAWRVLDAQYFGVPQRRRRVFLVGHIGGWRSAAEILFEPACLRRDNPPSRETRQSVAGTVDQSVAGGGRQYAPDIANPLTARMHKGINTTVDEGQTPIVTAYNLTPSNSNKDFNAREASYAQALTSKGGKPSARGGDVIAFDETQITHPENRSNPQPGDPSHPLVADGRPPTLASVSRVRRLTPLECERLQGFPDGYTDVDWLECCGLVIPESAGIYGCPNCEGDKTARRKSTSDSARYKMLGNSMAVPVMRWLGERIQKHAERLL